MSNQGDRTKSDSAKRAVNRRKMLLGGTTLAAAGALAASNSVQVAQAQAQTQPVTAASGRKPNIILVVSDDFGYGRCRMLFGR